MSWHTLPGPAPVLTGSVLQASRLAETVKIASLARIVSLSSADTVQVVRSKARVRAIAFSPKAPKKDLGQLALALSSNAVEVPCLLPPPVLRACSPASWSNAAWPKKATVHSLHAWPLHAAFGMAGSLVTEACGPTGVGDRGGGVRQAAQHRRGRPPVGGPRRSALRRRRPSC